MKAQFRPRTGMLTPRDLHMSEVCIASCVYRGPKRKPHFAEWWGIFVHRYLEYAKTKGRHYALSYIRKKFPRALKTCSAIDVDSIPDGENEADVLIDPLGRESYYAAYEDGEPSIHIFARSDLIFDDDKRGIKHVVDYKCGEKKHELENHDQLLTICSGVRTIELRDGIDKDVAASIVNVLSTGDLVWNTIVYPKKKLDQHLKRMRRVHLSVFEARAELADEGIEPIFNEGDHCERCDLKPVCPAHTGD